MKVKITWRALFPFPENTEEQLNKTAEKETDTLNLDEIETQAVLDTPVGCFLFEIELPHTIFRYDKQGNKKEYFKTTK